MIAKIRGAVWRWKYCWRCNYPVGDNERACANCGAGQA